MGRFKGGMFSGRFVDEILPPGQAEASNEIFSPSQEDFEHAELILDAYDWCMSETGGKKGSAMHGDEMIDEASRKMALVISGNWRLACGTPRSSTAAKRSQGLRAVDRDV